MLLFRGVELHHDWQQSRQARCFAQPWSTHRTRNSFVSSVRLFIVLQLILTNEAHS